MADSRKKSPKSGPKNDEPKSSQPIESSREVNHIMVQDPIPLLPLKDIVIFPQMIVSVFVNESICLNAIDAALEKDRKIFLSAFSESEDKDTDQPVSLKPPFDVYDLGVICSIMRTRKLPDGRLKVLVQGLEKAKLDTLVYAKPYPAVTCHVLPNANIEAPHAESEPMVRSVKQNLEKLVGLGKVLSPDMLMILEDVKEPGRLSDLVASNLGLKVGDAQRILATLDPIKRLEKVHFYLSREIEVYQMQVKIQSQAKEEMGKMQREQYLREQIRVLRSELGELDSSDDMDEMWSKIDALKLPEEVNTEVTRQLKRLERLHQETSEAGLVRNYLETVLALPWNIVTKDNLDIIKVAKTLDEDHYGLDLVKDRIIEFLSVKKLNPKAKSPIICFVGPPGVGKTSLGKSIAKAMGRKFERISLGGVRDEADVRGHRRTYVGAMPGRVVQGIKRANSINPVIMLDEIDKLGSDSRGDPSAAMLEVLDPEQNKGFVDHYLGFPFDLSKVMFIANANSLDTIPGPLKDRLEIIEVSGYNLEEKIEIAFQYLIPKQVKEAGLEKAGVSFSRSSVDTIINKYTRESGLRTLEKTVASICRKIARKYAENSAKPKNGRKSQNFKMTPSLVEKYLGANKFDSSFFYEKTTVGVAFGLAYTPYGGEVLAIETNLLPSKAPKLFLTGQLGDVMKESAQTAFSFIRSNLHAFSIDSEIIENSEIHIHIPAGAIPKDGPSAGITLTTSILSSLLGVAPENGIAMTGEITLNGYCLPIGGLKEKLLAAQRLGIKKVLIPSKNKAQYLELTGSIRKKIEVEFVKNYFEVFNVLFPDLAVDFGLDGAGKMLGNTPVGPDKIAS